jgi:hypothetical protein
MARKTGLTYRCVTYPDFEPDHVWLRQMMLFVDEVYRIVPAHMETEDSDELKQLIDLTKGDIKSLPPHPFRDISAEQVQNFCRAIDQPDFLKIAGAKKLTVTIRNSHSEVKDWEFLHVDKISPDVRRALSSRNMFRPLKLADESWEMVPRGVGGLVVSMLADQVAERNGFDAVTDKPLAFAVNSLNQCLARSTSLVDGLIASMVASVHVPKDIGLLSATEYVELRKRHSRVRGEFAHMVHEMRDAQRMGNPLSPADFRDRLDGIIEHVGDEVKRFRESKAASKVNEWIPFCLTSLLPIAATYLLGPLPGATIGLCSFTVNTIGKLTKRTEQFRYPRVLQTLCSTSDTVGTAALRKLTRQPKPNKWHPE